MHLNVHRVPWLDAQGVQRYAGLTQPVPTCHAGLCSQEVCCVPVPCCSGAFWVLEMMWELLLAAQCLKLPAGSPSPAAVWPGGEVMQLSAARRSSGYQPRYGL